MNFLFISIQKKLIAVSIVVRTAGEQNIHSEQSEVVLLIDLFLLSTLTDV